MPVLVEPKYQNMPIKAQIYVGTVCTVGTVTSIVALSQWNPHNLTRALCFLVVSAIASALKVTLPTITGTMSVNFLFILIGIVELDFPVHADYWLHRQPDSMLVEIQDEAQALSSCLQHRRDGYFGSHFLLRLSRKYGRHAQRHQPAAPRRDRLHVFSDEHHSGRSGDRHDRA